MLRVIVNCENFDPNFPSLIPNFQIPLHVQLPKSKLSNSSFSQQIKVQSWFYFLICLNFQNSFPSSIFPSFCGFEFKVFLFSRIFANLLHVNNFLVLFFDSLRPLESIFNISLSQIFCGFQFNISFFFRTFAVLLSFRIRRILSSSLCLMSCSCID